uniref:Uncharacterized protein n=1 Tax=Avena sativa TaxID=4498 RepID=A0ACD5Z7M9_AVESA
MERKGGCCLAPRYGGATGQEAWQMGNIMLKFRPIAPKPAAMAPAAPTPTPVTASLAAAGKGKRKAAAGGRGRRGRKPKKATTVAVLTTAAPATQKHKPLSSPSSSSSGTTSVDSSTPPPPPPPPAMPRQGDLAPAHDLVRHVAALQALRPVASCVTIESVTGTWRDGEAPSAAACGGGDEAPAFVSDQWGRVTWMNMAFSRAVSAGDAATAPPPASDAGVVLAARDGAAVPAWGTCAGFTCRVRVTYDACPRRGSLVAPCDVWRLDAGCYLWRLDLQATLTLSLGGLL